MKKIIFLMMFLGVFLIITEDSMAQIMSIDGDIRVNGKETLGITVRYQEINNNTPIILHSGMNQWKMLSNGAIVLRDNPKFGLTVQNQNIKDNTQIILHEGYNLWKVLSDGAIVLKDNPAFGLTVQSQNLNDNTNIILHRGYNTWTKAKSQKVEPTSPKAQNNPPNSSYKFCANEGQNCNYGGIVRIAYGVNGKFRYKSFRSPETGPGRYVSTSTVCNSRNFGGDPAPGIPKRCYILATSAGSSSRAITGRNVRIVRYNGGTFKQIGNEKTWAEYKSNNVEHARFTETGRDEWSVYLLKSDGAKIQLDLQRKEVKLNGSVLYRIVSFS